MVREWSRQATRAVGVSLVAPVVLLLAAGAVASSGGLGGLGSLGQIAGGPDLPDTGVPAGATASLNESDIVGADTSEPPATGAATADAASGSSPAGAAPSPTPPSSPGGGGEQGGGVDVSPLPQPPAAVAPAPPTPVAGSPPPVEVQPPSGGPVGDVIDDVRGIGESLPGPLGPTTGDILDLLLPPGSQ